MDNRNHQNPESNPREKRAVFHEEDLDEILEKLKSGAISIVQEYDASDTSADTGDTDSTVSDEASDTGNAADSGTDGKKEKKRGKRGKKKEPDEEEPFNLKNEIISWIQVLLTAAVIAFFINRFIIANSQVPTGSMETTIMPGDRVIGSRLSYQFGEPERGDIAIFIYPDDEIIRHVKTYYVKRIIGLPGDTIDIVDGHVYLNGSDTPLDEPYIREPMMVEPPMHYEVPEGCYFMMGDNRNYSNDARRWTNTYVKREKLVAKVLFQYFPKIQKLD